MKKVGKLGKDAGLHGRSYGVKRKDGRSAVAEQLRRSEPEWYVIQVMSGRERAMCALIQRTVDVHNATCAPDATLRLDEIFAPMFRTQKKIRGEFRTVERLLTPGYIVVATDSPDRLADLLRGVRELTRVLTAGGEYVPLSSAERAWAEQWTQRGERVIPMSFGYKEGDALTVTTGPLKGQEGRVDRIDRKHSLAHVEIHVGPMTIRTTIGLGVLPKE